METGSIKRAPGTGKKSKFTDEAAQIVEGQMQADHETTSEELAAILREKSAHVCARTAVKSTKFHTYVRTYELLFTYIRTCVNFTVFVPHVASQYVRSALTFLLLVPYLSSQIFQDATYYSLSLFEIGFSPYLPSLRVHVDKTLQSLTLLQSCSNTHNHLQ